MNECCVCGRSSAYTNCLGQRFCWPCADGDPIPGLTARLAAVEADSRAMKAALARLTYEDECNFQRVRSDYPEETP